MTDFKIQKATRQGVIPMIDLYSESGCGKTMSALLLARRLAGPSGEIAMIDTESRRGSLYADVIAGGFNVLDLDAPFHPNRYIEALKAVYATGAKVVVVDSMSHEWEGEGGVCFMADENERKSGKAGLHNWNDPKTKHNLLVRFLLRSPIPIICCIRAKYKTRQKKDSNGKTVIVRDEATSPIQSEDFIFEATCHAEILPKHNIILTKCSHPALRDCFPGPDDGPITVEHGAKLAKWCVAGNATSAPVLDDSTKKAKSKLWSALKTVRGTAQSWDAAEGWMLGKHIIKDSQTVATMTAEQLTDATNKVEIIFAEAGQSQPV